MPNSALEIRGLCVDYEDFRALDEVDLTVESGEIVALLGPSGSGKSTLLNAIAGLIPVASGRIILDGKDIADLPIHKRNIGLVFQDGQLFPHLTVGQNIGYGLRIKKVPAAKRETRVSELLELVGLAGFEDRNIQTLSGGQAQRVALARSLAPKPNLMLLDEPLSALDQDLKQKLALDLKRILHQAKIPVLYVTHDQAEAGTVADRITRIENGQLASC